MSLNDVRRQCQSSPRSNTAAASCSDAPSGPPHETGSPSRERSTLMHPGACAASASKRATAAASVGVHAPQAATLPSSSAENSIRPSGELRLSFDPAHHTTA